MYNLNTHAISPFYEIFSSEEAFRLAQRLSNTGENVVFIFALADNIPLKVRSDFALSRSSSLYHQI